jgi:DNA repair protein RadA/Sms
MTQAAKHYCKKCNRSVSAWAGNCPHCKGFNCIALGEPPKDGTNAFQDERPVKLSDVEDEAYDRISTGTRELDRVLGGGLVIGSVVLVSGDPGIGKSTLLTQTAIDLTVADTTDAETGEPAEPLVVLYVGPEETNAQIKLRTRRIGRGARDLYLYYQVNIFDIDKTIEEIEPDVLIIDSIQKMMHPEVEGTPGSVTQVRACNSYLVGICKQRKIACFMVAHITKDGSIAGPKTLEHDVDVVLEFHKEGQGDLRSVRASKNRFGSTSEMALFRMTGEGLESIENPTELLLEHHRDGVTGTCIAMAADGPRPLAVEIQTLMSGLDGDDEEEGLETLDLIAMKVGRRRKQQRRFVTGLDKARVNQVMAVLSARAGIPLNATETIISIAGGIEIRDPGLDLPLALALASFVLNTALPKSFCAFGEVGLGGEIRPVEYTEARIKSGKLMGFETIAGPRLSKREDPYAEVEKKEETEDFAQLADESEPPGAILDPDDDEDDNGEDRYMGFATLEEVLAAVLQMSADEKKKAKVAAKPKRRKSKKKSASVDEEVSALIACPPEEPFVSEAPPPI